MDKKQVKILQSWKTSFRNEILADIQHSLDGLLPGTILNSNESGYSWKVVARTIFIQVENQKRFKGEKEYFQRFTFKDPVIENYENFQRDIHEKERQDIYHYSIEPIGHDNKPKEGEILDLETTSFS
jgi:hypothetical protein